MCTVWEEKFGMRRCHLSSYSKVEKDSFGNKPFRQREWCPRRHPPGAPRWVHGCARRQASLRGAMGVKFQWWDQTGTRKPTAPWTLSILTSTCPNQRCLPSPQNPLYLQAFLCLSLASSPFWLFMSQNLAASSFFSCLHPTEVPLAQPSEAPRAGLLPVLRAHRGLCHCPSLAGHCLPPPCPLESLVREWPLLRSLRSHQVSAHRSRLPFPWRKVRVLWGPARETLCDVSPCPPRRCRVRGHTHIRMIWGECVRRPRLIKPMAFPVAMYGCESWTLKKAECLRVDAFELWCWRRLLRAPWTARRSNQPS